MSRFTPFIVSVTIKLAFAGTAEALYAYPAQSCPDLTTLADNLSAASAHVRYLSDDALGGREVGTPGARCAAGLLCNGL